jgi:S1-C subfamily serine protease
MLRRIVRVVLAFTVIPVLVAHFSDPAETSAFAQTSNVKLKVRAALYDHDLNLKAVPHLAIELRNLDAPASASISIQTNLDGNADAELPPGHYQLVAAKPVEFQGKTYTWTVDLHLTKPENSVELSNDNATATDLSGGRGAQVDQLADQFKRLKPSIVTIWTAEGHGTGFLVDPLGLIITNQHVVSDHTYLAAQFDSSHKITAELLSADKQRDVAVVRVNLSAIPEAVVAPIAQGQGTLLEGERVFTIGNPLDQEKVLTSGIVSKVSDDAIISDININPGNSGGPLFNSSGMVVGITTYGIERNSGPGLSGILPISVALESLADAKAKAASAPIPSARLLPVIPAAKYPPDGLRALGTKAWEKKVYYFTAGEFEVEIVTPVTAFSAAQEQATRAEKERDKRAKKAGATPAEAPQASNIDAKYDAVIRLHARPRLRTAWMKSLGEGMVTGGMAPNTMHFKADFLRMRLLCGTNVIEPIVPGRVPLTVVGQNAYVRVNDATYEGLYTYPADAISPQCQQVTLEIYSVKDPDKPVTHPLDGNAVQQIWNDFEPYRKVQSAAK